MQTAISNPISNFRFRFRFFGSLLPKRIRSQTVSSFNQIPNFPPNFYLSLQNLARKRVEVDRTDFPQSNQTTSNTKTLLPILHKLSRNISQILERAFTTISHNPFKPLQTSNLSLLHKLSKLSSTTSLINPFLKYLII